VLGEVCAVVLVRSVYVRLSGYVKLGQVSSGYMSGQVSSVCQVISGYLRLYKISSSLVRLCRVISSYLK
jgi:hypothetical protein